MASLPEASLV